MTTEWVVKVTEGYLWCGEVGRCLSDEMRVASLIDYQLGHMSYLCCVLCVF